MRLFWPSWNRTNHRQLTDKRQNEYKIRERYKQFFLDRKVHEYAQWHGAQAYEKLAEDEICKNTQGVNSGEAKDPETLKREHKPWQVEQKNRDDNFPKVL